MLNLLRMESDPLSLLSLASTTITIDEKCLITWVYVRVAELGRVTSQ